MLAVTSITKFFSVADVKCVAYEINKNNRANATHGPSLIQKMLRDRTEEMLEQRGSGPGPVLTLTLIIRAHLSTSKTDSGTFKNVVPLSTFQALKTKKVQGFQGPTGHLCQHEN